MVKYVFITPHPLPTPLLVGMAYMEAPKESKCAIWFSFAWDESPETASPTAAAAAAAVRVRSSARSSDRKEGSVPAPHHAFSRANNAPHAFVALDQGFCTSNTGFSD